jgi:hypothetical protein
MAKTGKPWLPPREGGYRAKARSSSASKTVSSGSSSGQWTVKRAERNSGSHEPTPPRGRAAVSPERKPGNAETR